MAQNKDDNKPTIIIKKGGHGGHHGGAWKIAYADFTTAMMCFFLCMWLINSASVQANHFC
jgi:chemotaxis protein MotB